MNSKSAEAAAEEVWNRSPSLMQTDVKAAGDGLSLGAVLIAAIVVGIAACACAHLRCHRCPGLLGAWLADQFRDGSRLRGRRHCGPILPDI